MSTPTIEITGTDEFPVPAARLYDRISDASFLLSCLEEYLGEVVESTRDRAAWKMSPPIPMMPGTLEMEMTFLRRVEPSLTHVRTEGKGLGGSGVVETINEIEPTDAGCRVKWTATVVETTGTLKMIPGMVLEPGLRQAILESWATIHAKLSET